MRRRFINVGSYVFQMIETELFSDLNVFGEPDDGVTLDLDLNYVPEPPKKGFLSKMNCFNKVIITYIREQLRRAGLSLT